MLARFSRPSIKRAFGLGLLALALLGPGVARADAVDPATRAAARKLGEDGTKLFDSGDYAGALDKYNLADQLVPLPTLGVRAARCLVKLGRLVEASERYLDVTRIKLDKSALAVQRKAQVDALEERDLLLPSIPSIEIVVSGPQGPGIHVTIDGKVVPPALIGQPRPIDPGDHAIAVTRESVVVSRRVVIAKTEHSRLAIELPPLSPSADKPKTAAVAKEPWQKVAGRAGIAIGIAGIVIGASHGVAAIAEQSSLNGRCPNRTCASDSFGALDFYNVTRAVSTVGFIAGGVAGAAGITLFLTAPKAGAEPTVGSIAPYVGPSGAGVRGEF